MILTREKSQRPNGRRIPGIVVWVQFRATRVTGVTQRLNAFRSINKPVTPDDIDIKTGELAGVVSPTALGKAKG